MAKYNGQTCILWATCVQASSEGLGAQQTERSVFIRKDKDRVLKSTTIGTTKTHSELNDKEIITTDIKSDLMISNSRFKKEYLNEALFDLYIDIFTVDGIIPNERLSQVVCQNISISEIKNIEKSFTLGADTTFSAACRVLSSNEDSTTKATTRIEIYKSIESFQKSEIIPDNPIWGNLQEGSGTDNCEAQALLLTNAKAELLIKDPPVTGKYIKNLAE